MFRQHKAAGDWGPMHDVKIKAIAEKYGKSAAHVSLRHLCVCVCVCVCVCGRCVF